MRIRPTVGGLVFIGLLLAGDGIGQELPAGAANLGPVVNSKYSDFAPFISADGNSLYFCSDREGGFGGQDIWVSRKGTDGKWGPPTNLGAPANTQLNEGPDTFSVDEQTMYLTGCNRKEGVGQCDIYVSHLQSDGKWSAAENLGAPVNTKYNEANASLSFNGRTLYFVSTRPTGLGGWDIWKTDLSDQGWSEPQNLGPSINTAQNEFIAFIHTNDEDLYFSSDGHGGFGGADIFRTQKTPNGWGEPVNLGPMINTPYNDMYFTLPGAGDLAYFSSNRGDTTGQEDLYSVPIPLVLKRPGVTIVKGIVADITTCAPPVMDPQRGIPVYDIKTCTPIPDSVVRLAYIETDQEVAVMKSRPDGSYQVVLPSGKNYSLSAFAKGYVFHSERFDIAQAAPYQVIEKNVLLNKLVEKAIITLNNIFFDFDKATLRPESKGDLNNLINLLRQNPTMRIEVRGHTDSKGSDEYNITLSHNRAKSVMDYLIKMGGIDAGRLLSYGYGERMPIASNATDEGRQMNRRVEFKILSP